MRLIGASTIQSMWQPTFVLKRMVGVRSNLKRYMDLRRSQPLTNSKRICDYLLKFLFDCYFAFAYCASILLSIISGFCIWVGHIRFKFFTIIWLIWNKHVIYILFSFKCWNTLEVFSLKSSLCNRLCIFQYTSVDAHSSILFPKFIEYLKPI